MKKFKSLMLAALASAALAAPSFADGHSLSMSGEIVLGMKYTSSNHQMVRIQPPCRIPTSVMSMLS